MKRLLIISSVLVLLACGEEPSLQPSQDQQLAKVRKVQASVDALMTSFGYVKSVKDGQISFNHSKAERFDDAKREALAKLLVANGYKLKDKQGIETGQAASSGKTNGCHLEIEVFWDGWCLMSVGYWSGCDGTITNCWNCVFGGDGCNVIN